MKNKELLFSVSIRDWRVETFRGSGPGGQLRNKVDSCVRITHEPSGAVGLGTEDRSQHKNKITAFRRMAESELFKKWHKIEVAKRIAQLSGKKIKTIEEIVEEQMSPENIRVETKVNGVWKNELEKVNEN